jgi:hypothetical protein
MAFEMTDADRIITIYNFSADTNEFIGKCDGFIPAHTGLPANSTDIAPQAIEEGFVAVFDYKENKWVLYEDHRGETVYDINTGKPFAIIHLGALPDNVVSIPPERSFVKWNGKEWIHDVDAERNALVSEAQAEKVRRLKEVTLEIEVLQDAIALDLSTADEQKELIELKKRRVQLNRIDPNEAPNIEWI